MANERVNEDEAEAILSNLKMEGRPSGETRKSSSHLKSLERTLHLDGLGRSLFGIIWWFGSGPTRFSSKVSVYEFGAERVVSSVFAKHMFE